MASDSGNVSCTLIIEMTTTAVAKVETVSRMRMVHCADDSSGFDMTIPTKAARKRMFTSRMRDFLQSKSSYVYPNGINQ